MKRPCMAARFLKSNPKNEWQFTPIIKYKTDQFHSLCDSQPALPSLRFTIELLN